MHNISHKLTYVHAGVHEFKASDLIMVAIPS